VRAEVKLRAGWKPISPLCSGNARGEEVGGDFVVRCSADDPSAAENEDLGRFVLDTEMFSDVAGEFSTAANLDQRDGNAGLLGPKSRDVTVSCQAGDASWTVFENDCQIPVGEAVVIIVSNQFWKAAWGCQTSHKQ
jgi:hypothetical protein